MRLMRLLGLAGHHAKSFRTHLVTTGQIGRLATIVVAREWDGSILEELVYTCALLPTQYCRS